ncbi:MAG: hypothetical protein WD801_16415 [Gemmatimonadaceae bacterium]
MLILLGLAAQLTVAVPSDTPPPSPPVRARPQAVEVSDWYQRRLTLHRRLSYAVLPLFAFQYAAGREKWDQAEGRGLAPAWARDGHLIGAYAIGTVFTANAVTGVWNLWDSRMVREGRTRRYLHGASMLTATAGFTWAGAVLSQQAATDPEKRRLHRSVAITSMAISVTSGLLMWFFND